MGDSCILWPTCKSTNKPSNLYKDLFKNVNLKEDRPTVNYLYAAYLQPGVAEKMDSLGYKRDENGEHSAKDVYKFFKVSEILHERASKSSQEKLAGVIDSDGNVISYIDGTEAIDKANNYNQSSKGYVAVVQKDGNVYKMRLLEKNSISARHQKTMEDAKKNIDNVRTIFEHEGFDFDSLLKEFPELFNVTDLVSSMRWIDNLSSTRNTNLRERDIEFLLTTLTGTQKDRLITAYGNTKDAAHAYYEHLTGTNSLSAAKLALFDAALTEAKKFNGMDIGKILTTINAATKEDSETNNLVKTIQELNKEFGINNVSLSVIGAKIKSLSDIASKAIVLLNRKLNEENSKTEINEDEILKLDEAKSKILSEMRKGHYSVALIHFLNLATKDLENIDVILKNVEGVEGTMEHARNMGTAIMQINAITSAYVEVLDHLSTLDSKIIDEDLLPEMKAGLVSSATDLATAFKNKLADIEMAKEQTMLEVLTLIFGESLPNGIDVTTLLTMARQDSSFMDYFYAFGKASNPIIAAMGGITRDAQDRRLALQRDVDNRLMKAENALRKAGHSNTEFMYDEKGKIINEYDWEAYWDEIKRRKKELIDSGVTGLELKMAMEQVKKDLTEEVVVDKKTGRTEKFPIFKKLDNPLNKLDATQRAYYDTVMEIKGELGTMLPEYARSHFSPPQIRRRLLDTPLKEWPKKIWNNVKNYWDREGDLEQVGRNALYVGDELLVKGEGEYDNSIKRRIPIFYTRPLKDKKELSKNFSEGISYLARTAINYHCMSEVLDLVRVMGDYTENLPVREERDGESIAQKVSGKGQTVVQRLFSYSKANNTTALIEGFLDAQYYGITLKSNSKLSKFTKYAKSLLSYSSFMALSTNVFGATSNWIAGEHQMLLDALSNSTINLADLTFAHAVLFGSKVLKSPGKIMDFFTGNKNSFDTLLGDLFDPQSDSFDELGRRQFTRNPLKRILGEEWSYKLYGIGENAIHYTMMYAILNHEKVLQNGKKISLHNALTKSDKEDGNRSIIVKDGVTTLDGKPLTDINDEYFAEIRRKIRKANQDCHGAMSQEDRGIISQRMFGRILMQMRQWMIEPYSKRYRKLHYDATSKDWREGTYVTGWNFIHDKITINFYKWWKEAKAERAIWQNLIDQYQQEKEHRTLNDAAFKSLEQEAGLAQNRLKNLRHMYAELITALSLIGLSIGAWDEPDDYDYDTWIARFLVYLEKRLATEAMGFTPVGAITEIRAIVKSPTMSTNTVGSLFYPIVGIGDITEEVESGVHEGDNKYLYKVKKKVIPGYKDYYKIIDLMEDTSTIEYYDPLYKMQNN